MTEFRKLKAAELSDRPGPKKAGQAREDHETNLAVRAAWLQFVGGHSQGEISDLLALSRTKVNRLIAQAQREGRVKVFIEGSAESCLMLERDLCSMFALESCDVVPNVSTMDPPFDVLGVAGARYLMRLADDGEVKLVGVGTGRTLSAMAEYVPQISRSDLDFVSLLGTFRRSTAVDPYDVVHLLAAKVSGRCFALPVPFVVDSPETKDVLLSQTFIRPIVEMQAEATVKIVGVGSISPAAHIVEIGMLTREEMAELKKSGAAAEAAGQFFDSDGRQIVSRISDRMIGHSAEDLRCGRTIVIAGGSAKTRAIAAALRAGFCTHLIIDEWTAGQIVLRREKDG